MSVTVAVHQPNYLPWVGYFHKIAQVDHFVFLDNTQYPRGRSVANRNRIKTAQGAQWLTVPVSLPKGTQGKASYLDVILRDDRWKKKHLKTLRVNYSRAPHFHPYFDQIAEILLQPLSFVEMNIALIRYFLSQLEIDTPLHRLSALPGVTGQKSELIVNICRRLEADTYLSGQGARKYNDETYYAANGIRLTYQEFTCPVYPQLFGEFVPDLSIVDLLFNCGPESRTVLLGG